MRIWFIHTRLDETRPYSSQPANVPVCAGVKMCHVTDTVSIWEVYQSEATEASECRCLGSKAENAFRGNTCIQYVWTNQNVSLEWTSLAPNKRVVHFCNTNVTKKAASYSSHQRRVSEKEGKMELWSLQRSATPSSRLWDCSGLSGVFQAFVSQQTEVKQTRDGDSLGKAPVLTETDFIHRKSSGSRSPFLPNLELCSTTELHRGYRRAANELTLRSRRAHAETEEQNKRPRGSAGVQTWKTPTSQQVINSLIKPQSAKTSDNIDRWNEKIPAFCSADRLESTDVVIVVIVLFRTIFTNQRSNWPCQNKSPHNVQPLAIQKPDEY